jgi:hypothetical protein
VEAPQFIGGMRRASTFTVREIDRSSHQGVSSVVRFMDSLKIADPKPSDKLLGYSQSSAAPALLPVHMTGEFRQSIYRWVYRK